MGLENTIDKVARTKCPCIENNLNYPHGVFGELGIPTWIWVSVQLGWTSLAILASFKLNNSAKWPSWIVAALWLPLSFLFNTVCFSGFYIREILISLLLGFGLLMWHGISAALLQREEMKKQIPGWPVLVPLVMNMAVFAYEFSVGKFSGIFD